MNGPFDFDNSTIPNTLNELTAAVDLLERNVTGEYGIPFEDTVTERRDVEELRSLAARILATTTI